VRTVLYLGGNRAGKTTFLINTLISFLLGYEPWSGRKMPFEPPVRIRLVGEDWTHTVKQVLIPKIDEWLPSKYIAKRKRNTQGVFYWYEFTNGSSLEIMTYEQNTESFEGWSGHVVCFDEPPPRDKVVASKRGLVDYNGYMFFSLSPLSEPYLYDQFIINPDPNVRTYYVDIEDNPYLTREAKDDFAKMIPEEERAARLHGQFLHLSGIIYKDYDKSIHYINPFKINQRYTCYAAIDVHLRLPQMVTFLAVDANNRYFVYDEIYKHGDEKDIADWVIDHHENIHPVYLVIIDPSSKGDVMRGSSIYDNIEEELSKYGIPLEAGSKDKSSGILRIKECLRSKNGLPSLFFFNNCERHHYEITHYIWDDWRRRAPTQDRQVPTDVDDHAMENLYRLLLIPPVFRESGYLHDLLKSTSMGYQATDKIAGY